MRIAAEDAAKKSRKRRGGNVGVDTAPADELQRVDERGELAARDAEGHAAQAHICGGYLVTDDTNKSENKVYERVSDDRREKRTSQTQRTEDRAHVPGRRVCVGADPGGGHLLCAVIARLHGNIFVNSIVANFHLLCIGFFRHDRFSFLILKGWPAL